MLGKRLNLIFISDMYLISIDMFSGTKKKKKKQMQL